jgi:hypothetical protein
MICNAIKGHNSSAKIGPGSLFVFCISAFNQGLARRIFKEALSSLGKGIPARAVSHAVSTIERLEADRTWTRPSHEAPEAHEEKARIQRKEPD